MKKISIIVPFYNAEDSLDRCINSILCQKWNNFELILVDDGSTDMSSVLADKMAIEDDRIKVIHENNRGVSCARNRGLEEVCGDYVTFVDSDDMMNSNCLMSLANSPDADLIVFGFTKIFKGDCEKVISLESTYVSSSFSARKVLAELKANLKTSEIFCFPWNKLYRVDVIRKYSIRFPEDIIFREDEIFNYRFAMHCNSLSFLPGNLYKYLCSDTGLTSRNRQASEYFSLASYIEKEGLFYDEKRFIGEQLQRASIYFTIAAIKEGGLFPLIKAFNHIRNMKGLGNVKSYSRKIAALIIKPCLLPSAIGFPLFFVSVMFFVIKKIKDINV